MEGLRSGRISQGDPQKAVGCQTDHKSFFLARFPFLSEVSPFSLHWLLEKGWPKSTLCYKLHVWPLAQR